MKEPLASICTNESRQSRKAGWLAIDVDGVLADHVAHVLPILERDFGVCASAAEITTWDFPVGATTFGAILRTQQKTDEFVLSTPLIPGAREAMAALAERHWIAVVTARPSEASAATRSWLANRRIPYDSFANLREGNKHLTTVPCDVLIDDYPVNVREFLGNSPGSAILFSQPWNWDHSDLQSHIEERRLALASNWSEVIATVDTMMGQRKIE